ncbi:hypothetical protein JXO59_01050 [candidate division KSB1 bacterium]|nr:hypothetical protein [candidate division KSB1 bacterium]
MIKAIIDPFTDRQVGFVLVLLSVLMSSKLLAQWQPTAGPYGGGIQCLAASGTNLFCGSQGGVFLSTNNGAEWTAVNSRLNNSKIKTITVMGINIFAGTHRLVWDASRVPSGVYCCHMRVADHISLKKLIILR